MSVLYFQKDHVPVDRLHQVIHQTITQKTNKTVFAVMTPFEIKIMLQMRLKEIRVMKSKKLEYRREMKKLWEKM